MRGGGRLCLVEIWHDFVQFVMLFRANLLGLAEAGNVHILYDKELGGIKGATDIEHWSQRHRSGAWHM